jgi:hypothetical protein
MRNIKQKKNPNKSQTHNKSDTRLPFIEHLYRLRRPSRYSHKVMELLKQDVEARAVRLAAAAGLKPFAQADATLSPATATPPTASQGQIDNFVPVATCPPMQRNFYRQPTVRKQSLEFRPTYNRSPQI